MRKYLAIMLTVLKEYSAYRLNFVLWRLRMLISLIITFFLWYAVFDQKTRFGPYEKNALLSYIIFSNLLANLVLGTRTIDIAGEINNGSIINHLLKPISFFKLYFVKDMGDKLINLVFSLLEVMLLIAVFHVSIIAPQNFFVGFVFLAVGICISFYINLILSFVGFWTTEVWAPRFLFLTLIFFLSGSYFPLDLLPPTIYRLFLLTPFPYLFYLPTKLFIGQAPDFLPLRFVISFLWLLITYVLAQWIWKDGNKRFSFWGR